MFNEMELKEYKNNYYSFWYNRYTDYKKCNEVNTIINLVQNAITEKLQYLNDGYVNCKEIKDDINNITIPEHVYKISDMDIQAITAEIEELTKLLNTMIQPEHETFIARLHNSKVFCEWDKVYKYQFIKAGTESYRNVVVKRFDNWYNHKIDGEQVEPFTVDHTFNILTI